MNYIILVRGYLGQCAVMEGLSDRPELLLGPPESGFSAGNVPKWVSCTELCNLSILCDL